MCEPTPMGPPSMIQVVDRVPLTKALKQLFSKTMMDTIMGKDDDVGLQENDPSCADDVAASAAFDWVHDPLIVEITENTGGAAVDIMKQKYAGGDFVNQFLQATNSTSTSACSSSFPFPPPLPPFGGGAAAANGNWKNNNYVFHVPQEEPTLQGNINAAENESSYKLDNCLSMLPPPPSRSDDDAAAAGVSVQKKHSGKITSNEGMRWNQQVVSSPSRSTPSSSHLSSCKLRTHQAQLWKQKFQELCDYKAIYGTCHVPHDWKGCPNWKGGNPSTLSKWVKRQRYQYKLRVEGKRTTLTQDREDALERLGFIWQSHKSAWDERFEEFKLFQQQHGHCRVTNNVNLDNPQLTIWVQCQRRQRRLFRRSCGTGSCGSGGYQQSPRSFMTEERIQKLDSLGFVWEPRRGDDGIST